MEKTNIGEPYEFQIDISATDQNGKQHDFKKGDIAWLGADNRMHTADGISVDAKVEGGSVESNGSINVFGVTEYLMHRVFGDYDAGSDIMQRINFALARGLAELFLTREEEKKNDTV